MTKSTGIYVRRGTRQQWVAEQQGKVICGCGCKQPIPLKPDHYGHVPRFIHGHNAKLVPPKPRKELPPQTLCGCGCGNMAAPGRQYLRGHHLRGKSRSAETRQKISAALSGPGGPQFGKTGPGAAHWKGGRTMNIHGYIEVQASKHPYAVRGGYIREHRLIAETALRESNPTSEFLTPDGYLSPGADVHHINERKHDNRVENLQVMWRGDHTRHHLPELIAARWPSR